MVQLASGRKEAPKDKPSQYCSGQEGCCSREGRSCPGRNLGWCPDTSAWVTLGVLHSRHCACKTSAFLHWEMVRGEGIGWVSGCMWQWVCHPNTPSPPSSLPGQPSPGEEITGQGKQCHYNTVRLSYPSILGGIIIPELFLLSSSALHLSWLLRPSPEHSTQQTGHMCVPRSTASGRCVAPK